jgi:hypothetical protein
MVRMSERPTRSPTETAILKVGPGQRDDACEVKFDLDFQTSLTVAERFSLMFRRSREMAELLRARGRGAPASITKRS